MKNIKIYLSILVLAICFSASGQSTIIENYTYDNAGRLTSVQYGNETSISYTYDPSGNLTSLVSKGLESSTIEGELSLNHISIIPNPADQIVNVKFSLAAHSEINISLYNALGELQHTFSSGFLNKGDHQFLLSTEAMLAGIYFCKIESQHFKLDRKVIIVH